MALRSLSSWTADRFLAPDRRAALALEGGDLELERDWLELSLGAVWAATINQPNQRDRLSGPRFRSGSEENRIVFVEESRAF